MKNALVVGGANGIGLAIASDLAARKDIEKVHIIDRSEINERYLHPKFEFHQFDLTSDDYSIFDKFKDIDTLMITAGIGKLALFRDVSEEHIIKSFQVNSLSVIRIIKHFYDKLESLDDFYCGVMVSIAGFMSSPFFSVYGATKAALKIFIESINVELEKSGTSNRVLNVSPGSIKGTSFYAGETDLSVLKSLSAEIIDNMVNKNDLLIPQYDTIFKEVLERYHKDFRAEGLHSYEYKLESGRLK